MIRRPINYGGAAIALVIFCLLAMAAGLGALALRGRAASINTLKVPSQYPSIQAAVDAAQPGAVVQVAPGTYRGTITLNKPIVLVAESFDSSYPVNNMTVIDGMGAAAAIIIPPNLAQMPTIRGFVIQNSGTAIQAQSPFTLEFSYLRAATYLVNYMTGSGGSNRNNIYHQSLDDAIHIENTSLPLTIENNRIMYAGDDGIEISLQSNPTQASLTEINISNNMIIGSREDGIQFIDFPSNPADTNRRFVIVGNLVANNKRAGIGLMPNATGGEDYSGAGVVEAIRVYNDTFYGNDIGISGGANLVAFNNIIASSTTRGVSKVRGPTGSSSVVAYTLFYKNGSDSDQSTIGPGIITGQDPLFARLPGPGPDGKWETVDDDFSGLLLSAGSPAIDRGVAQLVTATGEAVPPTPITGYSGSAPDLGWRQFGSPAAVTSLPTLVPTMTLQPTNTPFVLTSVVTQASTGTALIPPTGPSSTPTSTRIPPTQVQPTRVQPTQTQPVIPTASPTSLPPSATPTLGATSSPTTLPSATSTPGVTILGIVPASGQAGATLDVTITGTHFIDGVLVTFEGGQGLPPQVTLITLTDPQTMVVTLSLPADTSHGTQTWDVRVTNPDLATFVLVDAFTVTVGP